MSNETWWRKSAPAYLAGRQFARDFPGADSAMAAKAAERYSDYAESFLLGFQEGSGLLLSDPLDS